RCRSEEDTSEASERAGFRGVRARARDGRAEPRVPARGLSRRISAQDQIALGIRTASRAAGGARSLLRRQHGIRARARSRRRGRGGPPRAPAQYAATAAAFERRRGRGAQGRLARLPLVRRDGDRFAAAFRRRRLGLRRFTVVISVRGGTRLLEASLRRRPGFAWRTSREIRIDGLGAWGR